MMHQNRSDLSDFFVAGINYKKSDAAVRGDFAINNEQYTAICKLAHSFGVSEFFILSTCNRTEIYGFAHDASTLIKLLCTQTVGTLDTFLQLSYVHRSARAVQHLFEVGAGLESQIIGDYEITGQIKLAVKFAKQQGFTGAFTERLINSVLQSNKTIRNQTALSGGTVSVSFAAIQYIKKFFTHIHDKKILLLGTGKIGRNTCKNLVDYLETKNITLINRTEDKAADLATELGLRCAPLEDLSFHVKSSDIILVATNAVVPTISVSDLTRGGEKLVIDLSIPYNVEPEAKELQNVTLVNVDELSRLKDETLQKRLAEVPKAKAIIADIKSEFLSWSEMRKNAPVINAVKQKLNKMHECQMFLSAYAGLSSQSLALETANQHSINKVIKKLAVKMRQRHQPGCSYIEAINDFITTHHVN
jgi:glutamyl-tRNA reductase